jgi:hypothetical protein
VGSRVREERSTGVLTMLYPTFFVILAALVAVQLVCARIVDADTTLPLRRSED